MDLQSRNAELAAMAENIPGGMLCCRDDVFFTLCSVSNGFLGMIGYTRAELSANFADRLIALIYPADRAAALKRAGAAHENGAAVEFEYRIVRKDGGIRWFLNKSKLLRAGDGSRLFYGILLDSTDGKMEREERRLMMERHQVILNQTRDIIFEWDVQKDQMLFSDNWRHLFGYDALDGDMRARVPESAHLHPADKSKFVKIMEDIRMGIPYIETEFRVKNQADFYIWCRMRSTTQFNDAGEPVRAVGVILDIDAEKRQQQNLQAQAQLDVLTGLYNKATIKQKTQELLAGRQANALYALLLFDLDAFKSVNDRFGHLYGDAVLSDMATILNRAFRAADLVGRVGGDEFMVFMPSIPDVAAAAQRAQGVLESVQTMPICERTGARLTCSIGIALSPQDANDYYALYEYADQALCRVKNSGKCGFAFYKKDALLLEREQNGQVLLHSAAEKRVDGKVDQELLFAQAAEYAAELLNLYYARDLKSFLDALDENVMWIGPLRQQVGFGKANVAAFLHREEQIIFQLTEAEFHLASSDCNSCIVVGNFALCMDGASSYMLKCHQRVSMVFKVADERLWITHMHISECWDASDHATFPLRLSMQTYDQMQHLLQNQTDGGGKLTLYDTKRRVHFILESEIIYVESTNIHSQLYCVNGRILIADSISKFQGRLSERFVRIHRSYIINVDYVVGMERFAVRLCDGISIPVPEKKYVKLRRQISALLPPESSSQIVAAPKP